MLLTAVLAGPVDAAARALLGCRITAHGVTIRLTEVEAYAGTGEDAASHAHRGRTPRNAVMFGPAGYAYVYFTYGMHWCLNVVCGPEGLASAVLLRAGEVVDGLEVARERRRVRNDRDLARGPARLAQALALDGRVTGTSLVDGTGPALLTAPAEPIDPTVVRSGPRVGVTGAHDLEWRFWLADEQTVSVYRRHVPRARKPDSQ
jgi:DNA-3-methyladenine glycosylase